jgi:hypothetical protein
LRIKNIQRLRHNRLVPSFFCGNNQLTIAHACLFPTQLQLFLVLSWNFSLGRSALFQGT